MAIESREVLVMGHSGSERHLEEHPVGHSLSLASGVGSVWRLHPMGDCGVRAAEPPHVGMWAHSVPGALQTR